MGSPSAILKTIAGRRKYSSLLILWQLKYQQMWKINVNNSKPSIPIELHDLSPQNVSFLRKKSPIHRFFL
jgi:hypothetical protein